MSSGSGVEKEFIATDDDLVSNSHLFCAPEPLVAGRRRDAIENLEVLTRVVTIVVDEAHCVSKWYVDKYIDCDCLP
jgi:superfamily II DNA helicase RecQ